jgi:hypothetical protein
MDRCPNPFGIGALALPDTSHVEMETEIVVRGNRIREITRSG